MKMVQYRERLFTNGLLSIEDVNDQGCSTLSKETVRIWSEALFSKWN